MTTAPIANPTEIMAEHLSVLRAYAKRVLLEGEDLVTHEEQDKAGRLEEFLAIANSYKCTDREIVGLLYKGFLK